MNDFPAIPSNITCGKCWVVVSNIPDTFCLLILPYGRGEDDDIDDDDDNDDDDEEDDHDDDDDDDDDDDNDDDDDDEGDDDNDDDNDTLTRIKCALANFYLLPIHSELCFSPP